MDGFIVMVIVTIISVIGIASAAKKEEERRERENEETSRAQLAAWHRVETERRRAEEERIFLERQERQRLERIHAKAASERAARTPEVQTEDDPPRCPCCGTTVDIVSGGLCGGCDADDD